MIIRGSVILSLIGICLLFPLHAQSQTANKPHFTKMNVIRIGTGSEHGLYLPFGRLIAKYLNPPPCDIPCEEYNYVVVNRSAGSMANMRDLAAGRIDAAFVQASVLAALTDENYKDRHLYLEQVRLLLPLYDEVVHIVVPNNLTTHYIQALQGKKISIGESLSGSLLTADEIFPLLGLVKKSYQPVYMPMSLAESRLISGELDGLVYVVGAPVKSISGLISSGKFSLLPLGKNISQAFLQRHQTYRLHELPQTVYPELENRTVLVTPAVMVVRKESSEQLVKSILRVLLSDELRQDMVEKLNIHPDFTSMQALYRQFDQTDLQIHPTAEKYFEKIK